MAVVHFSGDLTHYTGGIETISLDAPRVLELRLALEARFPGVGARLEKLAIAIDGDIYNNADYRARRATSDVYFVPPIAGG
jgi:molybdopterin converting factor small subunit